MNESLRLPKDQVPAKLVLTGKEPDDVSLYLHPRSASHSSSERPSELLAEEKAFLPVMSDSMGIQFVQKSAIYWLTVAADIQNVGRTAAESELAERDAVQIRVTLKDNRSLMGTVHLELPEHSKRLLDFLNNAPIFFELHEGRAIHFVNKSQVLQVTAIED